MAGRHADIEMRREPSVAADQVQLHPNRAASSWREPAAAADPVQLHPNCAGIELARAPDPSEHGELHPSRRHRTVAGLKSRAAAVLQLADPGRGGKRSGSPVT